MEFAELGLLASVGNNNAGEVRIQTGHAIRLFRAIALRYADPMARQLGVFADVSLDNNLKMVIARLMGGRHLWSARKNGCQWNPKGRAYMGVNSWSTCPIEYDGEQCPDAFYDTCFETLFGPLSSPSDLSGTQEGQRMLGELLNLVYEGLGNSFHELYNFANHPLIKYANDNGLYAAPEAQWNDYYDQQMSGDCAGLYTLIDQLKEEGAKGYTMELAVDAAGNYVGNFTNDVSRLLASASPALRSAAQTGVMVNGVLRRPVIMATPDVFATYSNWIASIAAGNDAGYRYLVTGNDGVGNTLEALRWNNLPVVQMEGPAVFDEVTGAKSHRLVITMPQNFAVLDNMRDINRYNGFGLVVQRSPLLREKGKIYMHANLRWGAGIAEKDFTASASTILAPAA